jgi:CubicO group peptidase (beta-lactamase class C family)
MTHSTRYATGLLVLALSAAPAGTATATQGAAGAAASSSSFERTHAKQLAAFEEMVRKQMAADHAPGIAIAIADGDATWARAFGQADVEDGAPLKPESSFRLASITKPMTATAVLQLVEKGKMTLDAEIQTYVPYFPKKKTPVTVRQLLGHLGGISHYKNDAELHIREHRTTREAIAIFEGFDLVADPGTKFRYSTYGYNLLGAAIEGASGHAYGDYMRANVWNPAGMSDTRMDDPRAIIPNRVRGYEWKDGRLVNSEFIDISSRFAGGGTRTTVLDLLRFARASTAGRLVSRETFSKMTTPMTVADGHYTDYGMGWGIDPQNGRYVVSHSGGQNETRTLLYVLPARGMAIAAATNFESGNLSWYVQALASAVLGERWDGSGGSDAYVPARADRARFEAVRDAFQFGLSDYERRGRVITDDPKRLRDAFAFFRRCTDAEAAKKDPAALRKTCEEGLHPAGGEQIAIVGSHVASILAAKGLEPYHSGGPAAFFGDYVQAYRGSSAIPADLRLESGLERRIASWRRDWAKTFNAETRSPATSSSWGLNGPRLRETFAGASVYPDLSRDIDESVQLRTGRGDRTGTLEAARLSRALYPDLARPAVTLAAAELCFGEASKARPLLREAKSLERGQDLAGPRGLNGLAYELAGGGQLDGAAELLRIATEMYPREANLWDSLGELERKAGRRDRSIAAYRKALELDEKLESSRKALKDMEGGK